MKGKYPIRNYFEKIFGFVEYQEKTTFGLGYKLYLTRNSDNSALNKADTTKVGEIKNVHLFQYSTTCYYI